MALYVEVPKDFDEIKQKIFLGFTKRQLISFGIAAVMAGGTFWAVHDKLSVTNAAYCAFIAAVPAVIFALPPHNGLYLEQRLKLIYTFNSRKTSRLKTYQSEDIYDKIDKALEYKRLKRIVREYEGGRKK